MVVVWQVCDEAIVVVVASLVSVRKLGLWFDDVRIFRKVFWWLEKCCSFMVRVQWMSEVMCHWVMALGLNGFWQHMLMSSGYACVNA